MNKRELKNEIKEAFARETPDLKATVLARCEKEAQLPSPTVKKAERPARLRMFATPAFRRIAACALCLILFAAGIVTGHFLPTDPTAPPPSTPEVTPEPSPTVTTADTFVYLDVNPSIELQASSDGRVVACLAINEDAEPILANLQLIDTDMNTAISAIVGSLYVNGYLTEDANSILISVNTEEEEKSSSLLSSITQKINTVFEKSAMECSIIAQSIKVDDTLKARADQNGVSVSKMHLVDKMINNREDFSEDDVPRLTGMSIRELNLIYATRPDDSPSFDKDVSSGSVGGFIDKNDVLPLLLTALSLDGGSVERINLRATSRVEGGKHSMIYRADLFLKSGTRYFVEIDCQSGEILKIEEDSHEPDRHPHP